MEQSPETFIASEALFGFAGWLTSLEMPIIASSRHDAGVFARLVGEFCTTHHLREPREGWERRLLYPEHAGLWPRKGQ